MEYPASEHGRVVPGGDVLQQKTVAQDTLHTRLK